MTPAQTTFRIPVRNFREFQNKLAQLRKTAAKLNVGGDIGFAERGREKCEENGEFVLVEVWGEGPQLDGWSLRGRYDFKAVAGGCLFMAVPGGEALPAHLHTVDSGRCDHCSANRARNDVFLLQHEDGKFAVVGRSCLKHYLGHMSPSQVASWAQFIATVADEVREYEKGTWGPTYYPLLEVLTYAAYSVRCQGWRKSGTEGGTTRGLVQFLLDPPDGPTLQAKQEAVKEHKEHLARVDAKDRELAQLCLAWLALISPTSNYELALSSLVAGDEDAIVHRALGIAVSAIPAYLRALGEKVTYPSDLTHPQKPSVHVGELKQRLDFDLVYRGSNGYEGQYGYTYFHKFTDLDGNDFTWATAKELDLHVGDDIRLKATIKAHDEYKGRAQTKITRAKILTPEQ